MRWACEFEGGRRGELHISLAFDTRAVGIV